MHSEDVLTNTPKEAIFTRETSTASTVSIQTTPSPNPIQDQTLLQSKYASKGNGHNQEVSAEQLGKMEAVYAKLVQHSQLRSGPPELQAYFTMETVRRYLVARQWDEKKALAQLNDSVVFYSKQKPWTLRLVDSPACLNDPYALTMRVVGLDALKRPVLFGEFRHGLSRSNANHNVAHFQRVVESAQNIIRKQFALGLTSEAKQLQLVICVHFPGFGFQDMSLRTASECIKMMAHFPEFLGYVMLVDTPGIFSALWGKINALIDDRMREKMNFVSLKDLVAKTEPKIGRDMALWLEAEMKSSMAHDTKLHGKRAYWAIPADANAHDARGEQSYVNSPFYVTTPGDVWRQRQEEAKQ